MLDVECHRRPLENRQTTLVRKNFCPLRTSSVQSRANMDMFGKLRGRFKSNRLLFVSLAGLTGHLTWHLCILAFYYLINWFPFQTLTSTAVMSGRQRHQLVAWSACWKLFPWRENNSQDKAHLSLNTFSQRIKTNKICFWSRPTCNCCIY